MKQVIHLYCLCWNEVRLIPFFLRHFDFVDRFFVFDNGSTDGSLELLAADARVECTHFDSGDSFVLTEQRISNTAWKASIGVADWVFMIDMDEFIVHPDIRGLLQSCTRDGITAIEAVTFEMVGGGFPGANQRLTDTITRGVRSPDTKLCIFDPNKIVETDYRAGRHRSSPAGDVVMHASPPVMMLHYKRIGLTYYLARTRNLSKGLKRYDIEKRLGAHYLFPMRFLVEEFSKLRQQSAGVPGLNDPLEFAEFMRNEAAMASSDQFDHAWYETYYTDIPGNDMKSLGHFLARGWTEPGRYPNADSRFAAFIERRGVAPPGVKHPFLEYIESRSDPRAAH